MKTQIVAEVFNGRKIYKSELFDGCFIVILPHECRQATATMAHFKTIEEARQYISVTDDCPETWFERHMC